MSTKRNTNDSSKSGRVSKPAREGQVFYEHSGVGHSAPKRDNPKAVNNPVPGDGGKNSNGSTN